jgi:hypothetical protein
MQATLRFIKLVVGLTLFGIGARYYYHQNELAFTAATCLFMGIELAVLWTDWRKT